MFNCYKNAIFVECPVIFGKQLLPFSLGHSLLLMAANSPIAKNKPCSAADLFFAIDICTRTFEDGSKAVLDGSVGKSIAILTKIVAEEESLIEDAQSLFWMYFDQHNESPPMWDERVRGGNTDKTKRNPVPHPFTIAWALMERVSESRAWNMPLPRAYAYYAAYMVFHGNEMLIAEDPELEPEEAEGENGR